MVKSVDFGISTFVYRIQLCKADEVWISPSNGLDSTAVSQLSSPVIEAFTQIKNRGHVKYLNKTMEWWKHRKLQELISRVQSYSSKTQKSVKNKKH